MKKKVSPLQEKKIKMLYGLLSNKNIRIPIKTNQPPPPTPPPDMQKVAATRPLVNEYISVNSNYHIAEMFSDCGRKKAGIPLNKSKCFSVQLDISISWDYTRFDLFEILKLLF